MHRHYLLLIVLLLSLTQKAFGQRSVYDIDKKKETLLLGSGLIVSGAGWLVKNKVKPLTTTQLARLNVEYINPIDRQATLELKIKPAKTSDYLLLGSFGVQSLFLLNDRSRSDFAKIALLYGETYLLVSGLTTLTKSLVLRPRPYLFNEDVSTIDKLRKKARFSFFSGHTSVTAANCFFFASVFSDYFPDSRMKPVVWCLAVATPAVTAYLRVDAGKHFPTDVLIGYGVGATLGLLIPKWHKPNKTTQRLSIIPGIKSTLVTLRF